MDSKPAYAATLALTFHYCNGSSGSQSDTLCTICSPLAAKGKKEMASAVMASKRSSTKRLVTSERVYTSKDKLNVPLALCHCANCKCVTCKVFFFLSPHVRPWHCRKRPCRGAERMTWRGKRSPPTSRGRWATSRPKSRSTAPATPSCARRTAPWQRSWRGSYRSTTSERRYWSWHARTHRFKTKVKKWIYKPKPTRKPAWHNLSRTSHIWASAPVSNLWIIITFHPRLPFISCTISVLCSQKAPRARNETVCPCEDDS